MTDKQLKRALKAVYQPPEPPRKQRFLSRFAHPYLSNLQFMTIQLHYLTKWSLLLSVLVLLLSLFVLTFNPSTTTFQELWIVSALLPFVALSTVAEVNRSAVYHMEELEQATRFSLKAVLLARMGLLGLGNTALLLCIGVVNALMGLFTPMQTLFCLVTPYLLTVFLCLSIVRRWHGGENGYLCGAVSGLVSILCLVMSIKYEQCTQLLNSALPLLITALLALCTLWESKRYFTTINTTTLEELTWN